jgi:hypothetical protein
MDRDGLAETFSNVSGSNLTSLGFTVTDAVPYTGQWGYSLRMRGLDPKLNSNVYSRKVVIHGWGTMGAHEASWGKTATSMGCLMISMMESGRFWGMSDRPLHELVINKVKGGALVFTYSDVDEDNLILQSEWIKRSDIPGEETTEEEPVTPEPLKPTPQSEKEKSVVPEQGKPSPFPVEEVESEDEPVVSHKKPFRFKSKPAQAQAASDKD